MNNHQSDPNHDQANNNNGVSSRKRNLNQISQRNNDEIN